MLQTSEALPNAVPWGHAGWWGQVLGATAYLREEKTDPQRVPVTQTCCYSLRGSDGPGGGCLRARQVAFAHPPACAPQRFVGV